MAALDNQPTNVNFLAPTNFRFFIKKLPNVNFFIQKVTIPGISLGTVFQPNPLVRIPHPGTELDFGTLKISFIVDEDIRNYTEIYTWLTGLGFPENSSQYKTLADQPNYTGDGVVSDVSVNVLNSAKNPNFEFVFRDAFPIEVGELNFSTTETGIDYITADATFEYTLFTINRF